MSSFKIDRYRLFLVPKYMVMLEILIFISSFSPSHGRSSFASESSLWDLLTSYEPVSSFSSSACPYKIFVGNDGRFYFQSEGSSFPKSLEFSVSELVERSPIKVSEFSETLILGHKQLWEFKQSGSKAWMEETETLNCEDCLGKVDYLLIGLNPRTQHQLWNITYSELVHNEKTSYHLSSLALLFIVVFASFFYCQRTTEEPSQELTEYIDIKGNYSPPQRSIKKETFFSSKSEELNNGHYQRQFSYIRTLGRGGFGTVELAMHKLERTMYAIKMVRMNVRPGSLITDHKYFEEVRALMLLESKYVTRYFTCWAEKDLAVHSENSSGEDSQYETMPHPVTLCIQMEHCTGNNLAQWLMSRSSIEPARTYKIYMNVLKGVSYIHSKNVVHRDLKPANIFVDAEDNIKIGDFNLALLGTNSSFSHVGTPLYVPPESNNEFSVKVDVFSLGIILIECFSLFATEHERTLTLRDIRKSGTFPKQFAREFPVQSALSKWMISDDPDNRPTVEEVINSQLLADWQRQVSN